MVAKIIKDKGQRKSNPFPIILSSIGFLIVILLVINLFTPERVKNLNYVKYLQNKPQIITEDINEIVDCSYKVENPTYALYVLNLRKEQIAIYQQTEAYKECIQQYSQRSEFAQNYYCLKNFEPTIDPTNTNAPIQWLTVEKTCDKKIGEAKWFKVFDKKLFIVKRTFLEVSIRNKRKYTKILFIGCFLIAVGLVGMLLAKAKSPKKLSDNRKQFTKQGIKKSMPTDKEKS